VLYYSWELVSNPVIVHFRGRYTCSQQVLTVVENPKNKSQNRGKFLLLQNVVHNTTIMT
jgi:hypothetical protein